MKPYIVLLLSMFLLFACSTSKNAQVNTSYSGLTSDYTSDPTVAKKEKDTETAILEEKEPIIHIVAKGESLWIIAQKYGVTVKEIVDANNIENPSLIKIGQELIIPKSKSKGN